MEVIWRTSLLNKFRILALLLPVKLIKVKIILTIFVSTQTQIGHTPFCFMKSVISKYGYSGQCSISFLNILILYMLLVLDYMDIYILRQSPPPPCGLHSNSVTHKKKELRGKKTWNEWEREGIVAMGKNKFILIEKILDLSFKHDYVHLCFLFTDPLSPLCKYTLFDILGASEITANLYCNCVHLEGCVICCIYLLS